MDKKKQAEVLKYMLEQIYRADKHKNQLDARLRNIISGRQSETLSTTDAPADTRCLISDMESRILDQKNEIDRAMKQAMDIIDYLPINSIERQIYELRHIDFKPWDEISMEISMSRSQINRRYRAAVSLLLKNQHIQDITAEHEDEYDIYMHGKGTKDVRGRTDLENKCRNNVGNNTKKK